MAFQGYVLLLRPNGRAGASWPLYRRRRQRQRRLAAILLPCRVFSGAIGRGGPLRTALPLIYLDCQLVRASVGRVQPAALRSVSAGAAEWKGLLKEHIMNIWP